MIGGSKFWYFDRGGLNFWVITTNLRKTGYFYIKDAYLWAKFTCSALSFTFFSPKIWQNMWDQAFYTYLRYARWGRKAESLWEKKGIIILSCLWICFLYGNTKSKILTPTDKGFISVLPLNSYFLIDLLFVLIISWLTHNLSCLLITNDTYKLHFLIKTCTYWIVI